MKNDKILKIKYCYMVSSSHNPELSGPPVFLYAEDVPVIIMRRKIQSGGIAWGGNVHPVWHARPYPIEY